MSNFSNIGFGVQSVEEYKNLIIRILDNEPALQAHEAEKGTYWCYYDESGAEMWIQLTRNNEIIGVNPFFHAQEKVCVMLQEKINGQESIMDGSFFGWANPDDVDTKDSGDFPMVFDVPDFGVVEPLIETPCLAYVRLVAFAQEVQYFASEEDYYSEQSEGLKFSVRSFVPIGLIISSTQDEGQTPVSEAYALFTGSIKAVSLQTNEFTQVQFYHIVVETHNVQMSVVISAENMPVEPQINGILTGTFWLSGRIELLNPEIKHVFKTLKNHFPALSFRKFLPEIENALHQKMQKIFDKQKENTLSEFFDVPSPENEEMLAYLLDLAANSTYHREEILSENENNEEENSKSDDVTKE